jgi:hypothetical protein
MEPMDGEQRMKENTEMHMTMVDDLDANEEEMGN